MKNLVLPCLLSLVIFQNVTAQTDSTVIKGDLILRKNLVFRQEGANNPYENNIRHFKDVKYGMSVLSFMPVPASGTEREIKKPCNAIIPDYGPEPQSFPFLRDIVFPELIQIYGQSSNSSVLSMGIMNSDGIIALESYPGFENGGKLRLNPGCSNDVYICEGGGFTKIHGAAAIGENLRIGNGTFTGNALLQINSSANFPDVFKIADPFLTSSNKSVFSVNNTGKIIIGNQAGMVNSAMVNINLVGGSTASNAFDIFDQNSGKVNFRVKSNGFVYCREVNVQMANFPDYVFDSNYKLLSLENLEQYIKENHHLPNVPDAETVATEGAGVGELSRIQMEKIEELTLYIIELKKEIELLKKSVAK